MEKKMPIILTPYKEIKFGELSIYDFVQEGYTVPEKVIAYLQTKKPYIMSPGIYNHPFKEGETLFGPYLYTDGKYAWDRDTWKYVVKYHLTLPEDFIEHVMSEEGNVFLESCHYGADSWYQAFEESFADKPHMNFLPEDAGDVKLDEF